MGVQKQRVNLDNIFSIANSWDLNGKLKYMERINNCGYKTVIFTDGIPVKNGIDINQIPLFSKNKKAGKLAPVLMNFAPWKTHRHYEELFDPVDFLDGGNIGNQSIRSGLTNS